MRMEQYLTFTNQALWEMIVNGDSVPSVTSASFEGHVPPKTAEQKLARKNELKLKSTLMLVILDEHLLKFHACKDAIQEGLDKTYDRFQKLTSQLEIHVNTAHGVSAASSKDQASTTSYADDVMFSFFSNQSNSLQSDNEDLEQIDTDDLKEIDLKWQVVVMIGAFRAEEELTNFVLMSHTSSSDSEVHTCSKECIKSYNALQQQYDQQREAPNKSNLEITGYQIGLESLEARIVVHEKNEAVYEEDIAYDVQVKDISVKDLKNHQISAIDKTGLDYNGHVNESKVLNNVVNSCESDGDDNQVNDSMPPRADLSFTGLDDIVFKSKVSETTTSVPTIETNASKTSKDSLEKPMTVRLSAHLIEDLESNSKDENVFKPKEVKTTFKPSFEKIEFVNARNTIVDNESKAKKPRKFSQSPRGNKRNWNGYSIHSKAFRVFNTRTKIVEKNLHINFLKNKPNVAGNVPNRMFYIDSLTMSMNYQPVFVGNQTNGNAGEEEKKDAKSPGNDVPRQESQEIDTTINITNNLITVSPTVNVARL
nr:hypothetical protein [Tanacetum cinerariifolium]